MRNVYLYIGLFMLFGIHCFGQNLQNANWYFGDHAGINFNGSVTELTDMPLTNGFYNGNILKGCATVSSQNGALLFYTNGEEVFSHNHSQMDNGFGLFGHPASTQNAIIVPKPGNSNRFYILTIDGENGLGRGLHYSEVDMGMNGGLGKVITKNIPLKDHIGSGTPITIGYNYAGAQKAEKLTSTFNSDGINYWVITQIKDYIYSYSVTSSGISSQPVHNYLMPAQNATINGSVIKISPDGTRLATTNNLNGSGIGYYCGSFNTATGQISNMTTTIPIQTTNESPKSMAFSPNSQILYYMINSGNDTKLFKYNFITSQNVSAGNYNSTSNSIMGMELAMNGKIYFGNRITSNVSVLNTPDNWMNMGFAVVAVPLTRNYSGGLPQWVHWHEQQPCSSLTLTSESNPVFNYNNRSDITAHVDYNIATNTDIQMHARDFVVLQPNVHIASGSNYWARIQDCEGGGIEMRPSNMSATEPVKDIKSALFALYPNPAHDRVTLSAEAGITSITITSLDGLVMYSNKLSGKEKVHDVDVSRYGKGIYVVNITTANGKTESQKLMKD